MTGLNIVVDHSTKSRVRFAISNWDSWPHFLSAQDWTQSQRAILLEWKESGGGVRVQFKLGPTPMRQTIFEALLSAGVNVGSKGPLGKSWRQLANTGFGRDADDEDDAAFAKLIEVTARFLKAHVPAYAPVLEKVLTAG